MTPNSANDAVPGMILLVEEFDIPGPPEAVWPLLSDPIVVASCIPGATLESDDAAGSFRGSMKVKFGPTAVVFKGQIELIYDHDQRRCTIRGRGIDQRGASRANAYGTVSISGTDTTHGVLQGGFGLTGPLETFARTGGLHVARALLAEFVKNMTRIVVERAAATPAAATLRESGSMLSNSGSGTALSAFSLLRSALLGWVRQRFSRN